MSITNVKKLADLASTSLASYAYFTSKQDPSVNALLQEKGNPGGSGGVGMAPAQAQHFVDSYALLDYTTNSQNNKWGQTR